MRYGSDWEPRQLTIEGRFRGQLIALATTFEGGTASNELMQGGRRTTGTEELPPRSVILPEYYFGAYEALAARLDSLPIGSDVPIYVAPEGQTSATVDQITPRRIVTPDSTVEIREFALTLQLPSGPRPLNVWVDGDRRLARVVLAASSLVFVREDISSVLAREEKVSNPGDETVFIPAAGFSLGATITKPAEASERTRAIILVPGSGTRDRDLSVSGIPIFGQLAGQLADLGFFVVRYDKRGLGQSGGRTENATLDQYAEDVRGIVQWLRRRDDVDGDQIAVLGYGEGGAVALLAARREGRIKAVGLLGSASGTGREVVLDQQRRQLETLDLTDDERQALIRGQIQVLDAVVSGEGWEGVPLEIRRRADTPWFRSWIEFDPADVIRRIDEPILVLQGGLDLEVPSSSADELAALSEARGRATTFTRKVVIPEVNHLLIPAETGDPSEYDTLPDRTVSALVATAISDWLDQTMPVRRN